MLRDMKHRFEVETMGEKSSCCSCCGEESRCVWGMVHTKHETAAVYWMHWTKGHLDEPGANLDIVLGRWGDDSRPEDRYVVSMVHRQPADGTPALMVIDATERSIAREGLASTALRRGEVIGTPLAKEVFAVVDAIYEQDGRFF